ncbi:hypothetical protein DAPPUDRAFT_314878 [Daphnia pulex]|uniref:Uncharacterized protein n=1 Tax=Daphnia pulex TaxID=6669 RepID=E9G7T5_DAPPU|nr:hypothetical protein DAPPUDRAFT_314878 [Daphnia pulex]|eukprot:EFX84602.1 hypothetical protein DAPPUDRAFT_314878 [Daphnia pulex]
MVLPEQQLQETITFINRLVDECNLHREIQRSLKAIRPQFAIEYEYRVNNEISHNFIYFIMQPPILEAGWNGRKEALEAIIDMMPRAPRVRAKRSKFVERQVRKRRHNEYRVNNEISHNFIYFLVQPPILVAGWNGRKEALEAMIDMMPRVRAKRSKFVERQAAFSYNTLNPIQAHVFKCFSCQFDDVCHFMRH